MYDQYLARRLLFGIIGLFMLLPVQVLAQVQQCTFHDTGIVNLPAQITVPTNTPLGAVIATGEADIDFACQNKLLYFAFAKLGRCGDNNTGSFDCSSVSIENMMDNAAFNTGPYPRPSPYSIFYSPYMGVGIRMKVKYIDSNLSKKNANGQPALMYSMPGSTSGPVEVMPNSTMQSNYGAQTPPWGAAPYLMAKGRAPDTAGNAYWKGKLIVELIKIENRWPSQQAFDNYSLVSYKEFAENRPYNTSTNTGVAGHVSGKNGRPIALGYSGWGTQANLTREEFLSHALYLSFVSYSAPYNKVNPGTSRVYRLNTRIVEPITCTVTTPVVNVDMGAVSTDELDKGSAPEKTFNIGINCPGGARVAMAFADNSEPSNTSNTLTISKNSEAAGIGLQLRKDSTPITYNSSNSNMILVAELANAGFVNVPLVAKVVKTGPVKVRKYTAQSTITLGYQ